MTMRNYARFIPGEEIEAVEEWRFGAIDTAAQLMAAQVAVREAEQDDSQLEAERQKAHQAGYAAGMAQGRAQAEAELQNQMAAFLAGQAQDAAQNFSALFDATQAQLTDAQQTMAQGVLELSCELARQVLRQELSVNTTVLLPVIKEALEMLSAEHRSAVVRLHPTDMEALQGHTASDFSGMTLTLRADPALQQGGCVVESAGMVVDASLKKRWLRAVATLGLESAWEEAREPS